MILTGDFHFIHTEGRKWDVQTVYELNAIWKIPSLSAPYLGNVQSEICKIRVRYHGTYSGKNSCGNSYVNIFAMLAEVLIASEINLVHLFIPCLPLRPSYLLATWERLYYWEGLCRSGHSEL